MAQSPRHLSDCKMKSTYELTVQALRHARVLWPESLSDAQLDADLAYATARPERMTYTVRVLQREKETRAAAQSA